MEAVVIGRGSISVVSAKNDVAIKGYKMLDVIPTCFLLK
mgnify:CR=1 FL=1